MAESGTTFGVAPLETMRSMSGLEFLRSIADGRLPAPPHDAFGHTWHHPDDTLVRITKFGVAKAANLASYESSMPAYEGVLSDDEIVAALSWIKSQWPASIRVKHDEMNRSSSQQR